MASFEEEQQFSKGLLNTLFLLMAAFVFSMYFAVGLESEEGRNAFFMSVGFAALFLAFFNTLKLQTRVTGEGVEIKTLYLLSRLVRFDDIAGAEDVQYRPIRDYGGWGIRFGRNGMAYNMKGDRGVMLTLKNGKHILIGSQNSAALAAAIRAETA